MSLRHDNKQAGECDHCVCVWTSDGHISPSPPKRSETWLSVTKLVGSDPLIPTRGDPPLLLQKSPSSPSFRNLPTRSPSSFPS